MFLCSNPKFPQALSVVPAGQVATLGEKDELLFAALERVATRCLGKFTLQNLANTAWAFATVDRSDELLFAALARAAERRLDEFNARDLANTA